MRSRILMRCNLQNQTATMTQLTSLRPVDVVASTGAVHGRLQVGAGGTAAPVPSPCPPAAPHIWLNEFVVPHDEMN